MNASLLPYTRQFAATGSMLTDKQMANEPYCHSPSCPIQSSGALAIQVPLGMGKLPRIFFNYNQNDACNTGNPDSPFSAKLNPFSATRSRHTVPILGLILPFTAQLHPCYRYILTGTLHVLLVAGYNWNRGHRSDVAKSVKLYHETSRKMFYHWDWYVLTIYIYIYIYIYVFYPDLGYTSNVSEGFCANLFSEYLNKPCKISNSNKPQWIAGFFVYVDNETLWINQTV